MYPLKQSTAITIPVFAHDASGDAVTGLVDAGFTKRISKNGGSFAPMTVTITEMENGWYSVPISTGHSDTLGALSVTLTHASCKQINLQFRVESKLVADLNDVAATDIVSAGAITTSSGAISTVSTVSNGVTVTTNNDKTGYSLTQAFPTNFADMAITVTSGEVTVGTNNDKTGYTASSVTDKTGYSISGTITTLDGLENISTAEVNTEVDNSMVTYGLDHLVSTTVTGTDITNNSIIARMVSSAATADWDTFVNTDDSLQAISEAGGGDATAANQSIIITHLTDIKGGTWSSGTDTLELIRDKLTDIETDTAEIGAAGAGLTAVPWNANWDAEVESEVNDGLVAVGLDHMVSAAVVGTDITDNSIIAQMTSKSATADWDSFDNTTDSLEAIKDTGGGDATSANQTTIINHLTDIKGATWDATNSLEAIHDDVETVDTVVDGIQTDLDNATDGLGAIKTAVDGVQIDLDNGTDGLGAIKTAVDAVPTAADNADAVWDEAATGHTDAGKAGEQLWTDIDAVLTDTGTTLDGKINTIDTVVDGIQTDLDNATDGLGAIKTAVDAVPTAADNADAVWDEAATGHTDAGKAGEQLWTDVDAILTDTADMQLRVVAIETDTSSTLNDKIDTIDTNVDSILADTATPTKNAVFNNMSVFMVDSTDHVSAKTGLTLTVTRSIDGAAFGAATGTAAEVANGIYQFDASAADMNGDVITFRFAAAGADDSFITVLTKP